jgi:hypothetical protein
MTAKVHVVESLIHALPLTMTINFGTGKTIVIAETVVTVVIEEVGDGARRVGRAGILVAAADVNEMMHATKENHEKIPSRDAIERRTTMETRKSPSRMVRIRKRKRVKSNARSRVVKKLSLPRRAPKEAAGNRNESVTDQEEVAAPVAAVTDTIIEGVATLVRAPSQAKMYRLSGARGILIDTTALKNDTKHAPQVLEIAGVIPSEEGTERAPRALEIVGATPSEDEGPVRIQVGRRGAETRTETRVIGKPMYLELKKQEKTGERTRPMNSNPRLNPKVEWVWRQLLACAPSGMDSRL